MSSSKPHLGLAPDFGTRDPKSDFDISTFKTDGFSDFELDLTLLSNPPSPVPSSSEHSIMAVIPKRSPSIKSLALPFFSSSASSSHTNTNAPSPSPKLADTRGSWPLVKYVGRGTPIDQSRRIEWGVGSGSDELGVLFPSSSISRSASGIGIGGRGSSLDSGVGVGRRPSYVDWHTAPLHLNGNRANSPEPERERAQRFIEALPETSRLRITALEEPEDPDEWSGVMEAVMKSDGDGDGEKEQNGGAVQEQEREKAKEKEKQPEMIPESQSLALVPLAVSRSSQPSAFDAVLKKLDEGHSVDLGLRFGGGGSEEGSTSGNGGVNFFNLGLGTGARVSGSGRETPSVYSTAESVVERRNGVEERRSSGEEVVIEEQREVVKHDQEDAREHWWKKLVSRLRKLQVLLRGHRRV